LAWYFDDTKQIAVGIFQHDVIRIVRIPPRITAGSETDEAFDIGLAISSVEIEMQPASPLPRLTTFLEREVRSLPVRIAQHHPVVARSLPREIAERAAPERHHPVELVAIDHD
jgi:hypothetical protein